MLYTICAGPRCDSVLLLATECGNFVGEGGCLACCHFFCPHHLAQHLCTPLAPDKLERRALRLFRLAPPTSPFSNGLPDRLLDQDTLVVRPRAVGTP